MINIRYVPANENYTPGYDVIIIDNVDNLADLTKVLDEHYTFEDCSIALGSGAMYIVSQKTVPGTLRALYGELEEFKLGYSIRTV